jgi:HlyD family secretion protein
LNASADITTATRNGVLAVPIQAVVVREVDEDGNVIESGVADSDGDSDDGPRRRGEEKDGVFLVQDRTAIFTPVKTGIMGDTDIEVLEGLTAGQEIITGSYRTLRQLENEAKIKQQKKKKREKRS